MNGCGNFEFSLISNVRAHLAHAVYILRGEPTPGARIKTPRPIIGWSTDREWLVLWDWLEHSGGRIATLLPAPMATDEALVSFLGNWLDNSPMMLSSPDCDGSQAPDAFEIRSHWPDKDGRVRWPEVGAVFAIRKVWSEYHK